MVYGFNEQYSLHQYCGLPGPNKNQVYHQAARSDNENAAHYLNSMTPEELEKSMDNHRYG